MDQPQQFQDVTLGTLGGGVAEERFQQELEKVLENIHDPNTSAEAMRKIRIEVAFKPDAERNGVAIIISSSSKLAQFDGAPATIFTGRRNGRFVAVESNLKQLQMQWDAESAPTPIRGAKEKA